MLFADNLLDRKPAKMGITSPRFKSPTRQLRSARLRNRSLAEVDAQDANNFSNQLLPTLNSRRLALFSVACMIVFCPPVMIYVWYAHLFLDGSLTELRSFIKSDHGLLRLREIWPRPSFYTLKIISFFILSQALLVVTLPGPFYVGPVTPTGNRPVYKSNGFAAFSTTMLIYYILWREGFFNPASLHDLLGEILSTCMWISLVLAIALFIKGMELHPRIGRWFDIKVFINSRLGMMSWAILVMSYMCKQYQNNNGHVYDSMLVTGSLMLLYISKHFWLEQGYLSSLDISHDRAGLYNVWTSLVWIPLVYTSPALFLVSHPIHLGQMGAATIFFLGLISISLLFNSDNQKLLARHTKGKCEIWGQPITKINAHYLTANGERHTSILLTSGWWGKARHFHYLPEVFLALIWTLPCLFTHSLPYFYVISLVCFLYDRANRADLKCKRKYKKYWETYCKRVPWRIIPNVY